MNTVNILQGDCREVLRTLPEQSVQCCVTSPPYWGLRDYGHADQIGQEATPEEYVENLRAVFAEVRRVLKDDGTLWLNLGDSYCSQGASHDGRSGNQLGVGAARVWRNGSGRADGVVDERGQRNRNGNTVVGLKPKDLIGIPWRVALALQTDGWYLRSDIIWHKPNPMPESVTDRPTKSHEYIFLISKAENYHYDHGAIKERAEQAGRVRADRMGGNKYAEGVKHSDGSVFEGSEWRNKRSVWSVSTAPYREAHFATFPPDLIKPCILAGCPVGGTVLDPFGGSGTTGMVALELGRSAILIELNPDYVQLMRQRTNTTPGLAI